MPSPRSLIHGSLLLAILLGLSWTTATSQSSPVAQIVQEIHHANTYYWFGMEEKGNLAAFRDGQSHLEAAERLLASASLPPDQVQSYESQIQALRSDIMNQVDLSHDTFYANFPLVRFLTSTLFTDPLAAGHYEIIDDPAAMAATSAATVLVEKIIARWGMQPQLNVVFLSEPRRPDLENEVAYVFNTSEKFWVQNAHAVATILTAEQSAALYAGNITPEIVSALCSGFETDQILFVNIIEEDVVKGDHFYVLESRLHAPGNTAPTKSLLKMGFSRYRGGHFNSIILTNLALVLVSSLVYLLLTIISSRGTETSLLTRLTISLVAFAVGRIFPWIILPFFRALAPAPEDLVIVSFWWPMAVGLILFLGPMVAFRLASFRLQKFFPAFALENRGGAVAVSAVLGTCAYLAGPLFLWLEASALLFILNLAVSASLLSYILGKILDPEGGLPLPVVMIPVVMSLWLGLGLNLVSLPVLAWGTAVLGLGVIGVELAPRMREQRAGEEAKTNAASHLLAADQDLPGDVEELALRAADPPFLPVGQGFAQARHIIAPLREGKTVHLVLEGPGGVGKTATALCLLNLIKTESGTTPLFLEGQCEEILEQEAGPGGSGGEPFGPFKDAFEKHFDSRLFGSAASQLEQLDSVLDELFQVVPLPGIASLVIGSTDEASPGVQSQEEIFRAACNLLERLAQKRGPVVLFIDDAHWMDGASRQLLNVILEKFPAGGDLPLGVIVAQRPGLELAGFKEDSSVVVRDLALSEENKKEVLVQVLGIEPELSLSIIRKVIPPGQPAGGSPVEGELHWLFELIRQWAADGVFVLGEEFFELAPEYPSLDQVRLPGSYREAIDQYIQSFPQFRNILECAACFGLKFHASILSESLQWSRLRTLKTLDRVEERSGLIFDVKEEDDTYAFRSSYLLESIRRNLHIEGKGPSARDVPQVIREYHSRLAQSMEKVFGQRSDTVFQIADNYYAAGPSHAAAAARACIEAARASCRLFQFDKVESYIAKAEECARLGGNSGDIQEEVLLLRCDMAHVVGEEKDNAEAARKILAYLELQPDPSVRLLITATRACFDAKGDLIKEAARLGALVVDSANTDAEKAEGYQFMGLAEGNVQHLREAKLLAESHAQKNPREQLLLARICNSLGYKLVFGPPEAREEARGLFEQSLRIKENPEFRDLDGMTRDHSGLGWFFLQTTPADIAQARAHWTQALDLNEQTGSPQGLAVSHNMLGECDLLEGNPEAAMAHFRQSYLSNSNENSRSFAIKNLLTGSAALGLFLDPAQVDLADELTSDVLDKVVEQANRGLKEGKPEGLIGRAANLLKLVCGRGPVALIDETGQTVLAAIQEYPGRIKSGAVAEILTAIGWCGQHTTDSWTTELEALVRDREEK
jgi:tetratricopeptide (TPR) repeat protein